MLLIKIAEYLFRKTKERKDKITKKGTAILMDDVNSTKQRELITNLDFRGERILLPKIITNVTKFDETTDVLLKFEKGKLHIERIKID